MPGYDPVKGSNVVAPRLRKGNQKHPPKPPKFSAEYEETYLFAQANKIAEGRRQRGVPEQGLPEVRRGY